jgi:hypothetical protein
LELSIVQRNKAMKLKHWVNLFGVGLTAALITFLALRWAITSYADPTCQRYAASKGLTYVGFNPPDLNSDSGPSHMSRDGNCQLRASNGDLQTESLVGASGTNYGAPPLVSLALGWEVVFLGSFFGVAFLLAMVTRAFTPRRAAS